MKKRLLFIIILVLCTSSNAFACGFESTFRSYLDTRFWQPLIKYEDMLGKEFFRNQNKTSYEYSGIGNEETDRPVIGKIRAAYQKENYDQCRNLINWAFNQQLTDEERDEINLVDIKMDMMDAKLVDDSALLDNAAKRFSAYSKKTANPYRTSEARGWLAHIHYLKDEYSSAAKIYLDELANPKSVFSRHNLTTSLMILFRYNGSAARLYDHLEEYFDTPAHAIFVINLVTNPIYSNSIERKNMANAAQKILSTLQNHRELFNSGKDSEALTLAIMRTALYMGDVDTAMRYAALPKKSPVLENPEYNWMLASCCFLKSDYVGAEKPLLKMYHSAETSGMAKKAAAQGLIGVYFKTGKKIDQLHAAFLYEAAANECLNAEKSPIVDPPLYMPWPYDGWLFDLPYLLDIELSDAELEEYLVRHGQKRLKAVSGYYSRPRSSIEMVEYALAVRYARKEQYEKAASIFEQIGAKPRSARMKKLVGLYENAANLHMEKNSNLEAKYTYASFLEANSTGIFFNDMLWHGYQTWSFISIKGEHLGYRYDGLTRKERDDFIKKERRIRDDQEERWRAYRIFSSIVDEAGPSELGIRAAKKALICLGKISSGRFGRKDEIGHGQAHLIGWLRKHGDFRGIVTKKKRD
jgi:hypothetical protein